MQLPQERLNEIARRRLARVGLQGAVPGDGGALEGTIAFHTVAHPLTKERVSEARYRVVGHDRLAFLDGIVALLDPVYFHDVGTAVVLEQRLQQQLDAAAAAARAGARELLRLGIEIELDHDAIAALVELVSGGRHFVIQAYPKRARVVQVRSGNQLHTVAANAAAWIDLAALATRTDLELELGVRWPQLEIASTSAAPATAAAAAAPAPAPSSTAPTTPATSAAAPAPQPAGPLVAVPVSTLSGVALPSLLTRFGSHARARALEIREEFTDGAETFHLRAELVQESTFRVEIVKGSGERVFQDAVDITRVDGTFALLHTVLGRTVQQPAAPPKHASSSSSSSSSGAGEHVMQPHPGEVWIMMVLVEREDEHEIRYVLADYDGRPFGAQRVLARADFLAVFQEVRGSYRLRVRIEGMRGQDVVYRQLDAAENPAPDARAVPLATFTSTFFPEAMAY